MFELTSKCFKNTFLRKEKLLFHTFHTNLRIAQTNVMNISLYTTVVNN